jgi:hypothetical protein
MTSLPIYQFIVIFLFGFSVLTSAQDRQISVEVPKASLGIEEELAYIVTIKSTSSPFNGIIPSFPNLEGFTKGIQKISHSRLIENGKPSYVDVVRQVYIPKKIGQFRLPGFQLTIDKQVFPVNALEVSITAPLDKISFQNVPALTKEQAQNAFLSVSVSKKEIYVGEGVLVDVSFFVPDISQSDWEFPKNIAEQVEKIAQKLKPLDCLENRIIITNIKGESTQIQGNKFTKYQLFLSWYYPLNPKRLSLPAVQFAPQRKLKNEKSAFSPVTLTTQPQAVEVKDLPDHPLKGKVVVGTFDFSESIQRNPVEVGKPFRYIVKIEGIGNLTLGSSITPIGDEKFDIYSENVTNSPFSSFPKNGKEFAFQITPKELGITPLGDYFRLYYFNTQSQEYDTLSSKINLKVVGDSSSLDNIRIRKTDLFDGLSDTMTPDSFLDKRSLFLQFTNGLLICMLVATGLLFYTKNNK